MKGIQDTSSETFRQLLGNGLTYEIPKFQRDYSWDTEQWDDLWQDIQVIKSVRKNDLFKAIRRSIRTKQEAFSLIRELDVNTDLYVALRNPNDVVRRSIRSR